MHIVGIGPANTGLNPAYADFYFPDHFPLGSLCLYVYHGLVYSEVVYVPDLRGKTISMGVLQPITVCLDLRSCL